MTDWLSERQRGSNNNQLGETNNCGKGDCNPCVSGTTKEGCKRRYGLQVQLSDLQASCGKLVPWHVSTYTVHTPR